MKLEISLHHPLTANQNKVLKSKKDHLYIVGPAGTAKTYTALARGMMKYNAGEVDRIIVIRSAVEIRKIGHLPGDAEEKLDPYAETYNDLVSSLSPKHNYRALKSKGIIEFESTTFLRGRTFDDAFIIVDEYQNLSDHELDTVLTRVGVKTQICVVGDERRQSDLPKHEQRDNEIAVNAFQSMEEVETIRFTYKDIVRSGFVKSYYIARTIAETGSALPDQLLGR